MNTRTAALESALKFNGASSAPDLNTLSRAGEVEAVVVAGAHAAQRCFGAPANVASAHLVVAACNQESLRGETVRVAKGGGRRREAGRDKAAETGSGRQHWTCSLRSRSSSSVATATSPSSSTSSSDVDSHSASESELSFLQHRCPSSQVS